jgi:putative hydrolase of the HAD superfamily
MIKNIIFDLGGVLFSINYDRTFVQLGKLVGHDLSVGSWPDWFKNLVIQYETGQIKTENFLLTLQMKRNRVPIPHGNELVKAWNSMLIGWQDDVFSMLELLSRDYRLFILSNINPLHEQQLIYSFTDKSNYLSFLDIFQGVYFSHKIGFRKPDERGFQLIIDEHNLVPEQTLFIDDYPKNILGAQKMGLHNVVHDPDTNINNKIKIYLGLDC